MLVRTKRRRCIAAGPSILALAITAAGCRAAAGGASSGETRVVAKAVEDVFLLGGELRAVRSVSLATPRSEGRTQIRWLAEDGAEVAEGERVAELDSTNLIQRLEDRRLRLRQAELSRESLERSSAAEMERRRSAVQKAEVEDEKSRLEASVPLEYRDPKERPVLQSKWQQTRATLEKARLDLEAYRVTSRADITAARAAEEKLRRELETAEKGLSGMSLLAPRAGIFVIGMFYNWGPEGPRKLQPGDFVWPGYPLGAIPDPSEMEVEASLAESDDGRIKVGMQARCVLDTYPDRIFKGHVASIGSVAAEASQGFAGASLRPGFPVHVSLARTDALMRPGLSVRVEVVRAAWPKALSVPRGAVRFEKQGPVVRKNGALVAVRLSSCTPLECIIDSGLVEGDRVALF